MALFVFGVTLAVAAGILMLDETIRYFTNLK